MTSALLAVVVSLSASTGRAAGLAPAAPASVRAADAFPGWGPLGEPEDPLESLGRDDEDLRDAFAAPPSAMWLQNDLRTADLAGKLSAVRAAARPHNVDAIPTLSGVLLRLDQPSALRAAAALALGRIRDRVAATVLAQGLRDPSPEVRAASALALGRLRAHDFTVDLEHALLADLAWPARYAAAVALARFPGSDLPLTTALSADAAWQVRQQAARSLQFVPTRLALRTLTRALSDPEASVRASAAYSLGEIGGPEELRRLSAALRDEKDPAARLVMQDAERVALSRP
jgi:HEAT repeat protein